MLVDLNQVFVTMEGKKMQDRREEKGEDDKIVVTFQDLTLYRIMTLALSEPAQNTKADDKIKYYELILKIVANKGGSVDLESEDVTILKNAIKMKYNGPLIVGEAVEMLEGREVSLKLLESEKIDPPMDKTPEESEVEPVEPISNPNPEPVKELEPEPEKEVPELESEDTCESDEVAEPEPANPESEDKKEVLPVESV